MLQPIKSSLKKLVKFSEKLEKFASTLEKLEKLKISDVQTSKADFYVGFLHTRIYNPFLGRRAICFGGFIVFFF